MGGRRGSRPRRRRQGGQPPRRRRQHDERPSRSLCQRGGDRAESVVAADDAAARDGAQYPAVGVRALGAVSSAFSLHELEELRLHLMPLLLVVHAAHAVRAILLDLLVKHHEAPCARVLCLAPRGRFDCPATLVQPLAHVERRVVRLRPRG